MTTKTVSVLPSFYFQTFKAFKVAVATYLADKELLLEEVGAAAFREYMTLHPELPEDAKEILVELKAGNVDKTGRDRGLASVFFKSEGDLHREVNKYKAQNEITLKDLGAIVLFSYMRKHP